MKNKKSKKFGRKKLEKKKTSTKMSTWKLLEIK
jgi:hypothetical protein